VTNVPADEIRARQRAAFDGAFGRVYSFLMQPPWLGRAVFAAYWGATRGEIAGREVANGNVHDEGTG
jgi:hypothetical protein